MEWDRKIHLRVGNRIKVMSVADRIRLDIMSGRLRHLDLIDYKTVSKHYDVSRVIAREALKRLLAEGFLKSTWLGLRIVSLSPTEAWEVTSDRIASEPAVLQASVPLMGRERIERMCKLVDMFDGTRNPNFNAWIDDRLAGALYIRGSSDKYQILSEARLKYGNYQNFLWQNTDELHRHKEDFSRIVTLCERRDARGAGDTVRNHILHSGRALKARLRDLRGSPLFHASRS
jgi:DNA-binding GntR family transcriptional regulator